MAKSADLEETKRLMGALGRMPPKQHSEMKLGEPTGRAAQFAKKRAKRGVFPPAQKPPSGLLDKFGLCSVSWPVRQALALCTLESIRRPFPIGNAEAGTIVVAELKFVQITR